MALVALLTRDVEVERAVRNALNHHHLVVRSGRWDRLLTAVRERPVTCVVLDEADLPPLARSAGAAAELRDRFPSVAVVWMSRPGTDPHDLLALGRVGVDRLLLIHVDDVTRGVGEGVAQALGRGTEALVTRSLSPYLPPRPMAAVRMALREVHRRPRADEVAGWMGLTRPHVSVCLKEHGLPSLGHLLVWGRLLHAGRWLTDGGRSAESVSRQLEYANGAVFRRALRQYLGATPTEIIREGGLPFVLDRFMQRCGLSHAGRNDRTAA